VNSILVVIKTEATILAFILAIEIYGMIKGFTAFMGCLLDPAYFFFPFTSFYSSFLTIGDDIIQTVTTRIYGASFPLIAMMIISMVSFSG